MEEFECGVGLLVEVIMEELLETLRKAGMEVDPIVEEEMSIVLAKLLAPVWRSCDQSSAIAEILDAIDALSP